mmetsp:Transcript_2449/g.3774  ORF Transcript_2449/g.3774 Transcript_2449/m.3774 type:complete len:161 (+) Transcript_2449:3-485(+)
MSWPPDGAKIEECVNKILQGGKGKGKGASDMPPDVALTMYAAHLLVRAAGGDDGAATFEGPVGTPFMDDEVLGALAHLAERAEESESTREKLCARGMEKVIDHLVQQNMAHTDAVDRCSRLVVAACVHHANKEKFAETSLRSSLQPLERDLPKAAVAALS